MRARAAMVFMIGMFCGALVLGGGYLAFDTLTEDAQAQSTATWQTKNFDAPFWNGGFVAPDPERFFDDWIHTMPIECDIHIIGDQNALIFYRCPES